MQKKTNKLSVLGLLYISLLVFVYNCESLILATEKTNVHLNKISGDLSFGMIWTKREIAMLAIFCRSLRSGPWTIIQGLPEGIMYAL